MTKYSKIVITGGPGGGKTTFIQELVRDYTWRSRFVALPETIFVMSQMGISSQERLFQQVMVFLQMSLEDGLSRALELEKCWTILCHRGSLDPLAYWLDRGWLEEDFFTRTNTTLEHHYQRYTAVIHLVTAADGAQEYYTRWPEAHRPEQIEDAIRLDRSLQRIWSNHPNYFLIDNEARDWRMKSELARNILSNFVP